MCLNHFDLLSSILLHYDNLSVTYLAANPVHRTRTCHVKLDYHFVRETVAIGSHRICSIPSADQPADLLTKALISLIMESFVPKLSNPASPICGVLDQLIRNLLRDCSKYLGM